MINNTNDLLLGVVAAASPTTYQRSLQKLQLAQRTSGAVPSSNATESKNAFQNLLAKQEVSAVSNKSIGSTALVRKNTKAYQEFEAFMLQSFVENMFTSDNSKVFGKGQAGKIWQSMMSEAIAKEMAANGGIGIAKMLLKQANVKEQQTDIADNKPVFKSLFSVVDHQNPAVEKDPLRNIYAAKHA